MKIHPLTLSFRDEYKYLEEDYVASQFEKSLMLQRVIIVLLPCLYALFGILDFYVAPEQKYFFWFIRYALVCPFSFGIVIFSFTRFFRRFNNVSLFLLFIVGGVGIDIMILVADPLVAHSYYAGLILFLIGIHTVIRMRFIWAFSGSWLIIIFYEIIALWLIETPTILLLNNNFFIISANIICIIAGYSMERSFRRSFFLNHMLDREKEMVALKNLELKDRVKRQNDAEQALLKKTHEIEQIVTERTLQLQQTKEKFKELVEHINDLIFIIDDTGVVTYISPVVEQVFGYCPSDVEGRKFFDFLHKEESIAVINWFQNKPSGSIDSVELRLCSKSGEYHWVTVSLRIEVKPGKGWIARGVLRDITKVKILEAQLRQSQKMEAIGTLSGGIAHDFNNILSPIIGYTEMLITRMPSGSPHIRKLNGIYKSALRAAALARQILTFSREENTDLREIKIQPIIAEALKLIRSTIPTTIEIKQDLQNDCRAIKADSTQMHQIIMNLATNAYHAMEETGGELKIGLTEINLSPSDLIDPEMQSGVYAYLTISDQGKGMTKELTEKIFDPFFTTKEKGKGTGMGLSVVHGIVKSMNGAIKVYSEPGKGTEFKLYFPIERNSFEESAVETESALIGGCERILLIDDEPDIVDMAEEMLRLLGYDVTSCLSSVEGFDIFQSNPDNFDLVITDMAMPGLPGDRLAVKLAGVRPDIPVLLCTGFSEVMSEEKAAACGIKGFLMKPIVMQDFAQKIWSVLDGEKRPAK